MGGLGALGSPVAIGAARLGVRHLTLIDHDALEEHNLENQVYDESDIGKPKVVAMKDRLRLIDPDVDVRAFCGRIQDFAGKLDFDVYLGCFDNVAARYYLNSMAVANDVPYIDSGIRGFLGTVTTVIPGETACYECEPFLPKNPPKASCSEDPQPTTYVTAAAAASIQLTQLIKLIHKQSMKSHILFDLTKNAIYPGDYATNPDCALCGVLG